MSDKRIAGLRRAEAAARTTLRVALFSLNVFYTLPFVRTKGNRKTAAVKRFRTEGGLAPALNRMPSALLKQSKVRLRRRFLASAKPEQVRLCPRLTENVLRFFTLRRCGRPLSEIASAAGWAGAREYCSPQNCAARIKKKQPSENRRPLNSYPEAGYSTGISLLTFFEPIRANESM